ncbi:MAG: hypothetical protein HYU36_09570 [Planctomycetes bacterium]|nr:hypothetical protein [Planctomycetota bacterium]
MRFYFHGDAETEFDKAVAYYEECRSGLGLEFAQEVYAAIARVIQFPDAWSPMSKNTRRCLVTRFPFGIIYRIKLGYLRSWRSPIFAVDLAIGGTDECAEPCAPARLRIDRRFAAVNASRRFAPPNHSLARTPALPSASKLATIKAGAAQLGARLGRQ